MVGCLVGGICGYPVDVQVRSVNVSVKCEMGGFMFT